VCHHPPLYYVLAAPVYAALRATAIDPTRGLQLFSLVMWSAFVAFAALAVRRLVAHPWQRVVASSLVLFWPYAIVQSVRVNNDTLLDVLAAATIYFVVRWRDEPRQRWLGAAGVCAVAALLTKATGLVLVALVFVAAALAIARAADHRALRRVATPPLVALAICATTFVAVRSGGVLGSATRFVEPRGVAFYLRFSPSAMIATPWANVSMSKTSEPGYWNHLLKSSLYGARTFGRVPPGAVQPSRALARVENGAVMLLGAVLAIGLALGRRDRAARRLLAAAIAATVLAGGLAFHLLAPNDHHADFRFVFPIVIPLAALYAWSCEGLRARRVPYVGEIVAAIFLAIAIVSLVHMDPDAADARPLFPFVAA